MFCSSDGGRKKKSCGKSKTKGSEIWKMKIKLWVMCVYALCLHSFFRLRSAYLNFSLFQKDDSSSLPGWEEKKGEKNNKGNMHVLIIYYKRTKKKRKKKEWESHLTFHSSPRAFTHMCMGLSSSCSASGCEIKVGGRKMRKSFFFSYFSSTFPSAQWACTSKSFCWMGEKRARWF